jgi:hypothetical protein
MAAAESAPPGGAEIMNRAPKRSRTPLAALAVVTVLTAAVVLPALAQKAKLTVDDDCTAFAFSPDGSRIVYAARRISSERVTRSKRMRVEHDDIWQVTIDNGHEHRLVDGKKLVKSPVPVSYQIQSIRIAPDGQHMTVQMLTRTLIPTRGEGGEERPGVPGRVQSGELTDLMDGQGKEIDIYGTKPKNSAIFGATNAAWLADGQTVVYMTQPKDSLLYQLAYVRPVSGVGGPMLPKHYYAAVSWSPAHNAGAAIERDKDFKEPAKLVWIDLVRQTERTLAPLKGFSGHLTVSPSGKEVAYFSDGNTISIRSVADPSKVTRIKVPFGRYEWSADGTHLLLKRGADDHTDQLIWISLPSGQYHDVFHGLIYHNFHVSPDGKWVGVTEPGKQILKLLPVP